jgi:hypothetical protein
MASRVQATIERIVANALTRQAAADRLGVSARSISDLRNAGRQRETSRRQAA